MTEVKAGESIYVYGFALPDAMPPLIMGVDDLHPLMFFTYAGVNVIFSLVALADFTGESGEHNLQNATWLTPRLCRHALVLDKMLADSIPVYPVPFGTLFSGMAAVEQELDRCAVDVVKMLHHITGCQEWAIEATLDRNQAIESLFTEGLHTGRFNLPEAKGRRHLEEQKLRRQLSNELNDWLTERLNLFQTELRPLAQDFRARRFQEDKVLNWAYLLSTANVSAFQQQLTAIANHHGAFGFQFRLTGPWVAYSFCQQAKS